MKSVSARRSVIRESTDSSSIFSGCCKRRGCRCSWLGRNNPTKLLNAVSIQSPEAASLSRFSCMNGNWTGNFLVEKQGDGGAAVTIQDDVFLIDQATLSRTIAFDTCLFKTGSIAWETLLFISILVAKTRSGRAVTMNRCLVGSRNPYGPCSFKFDTESQKGIQGFTTALGHEPHNYVMVYVEVADIASHIQLLESLGGKVVIPETQVPDSGSFARCSDPEGNTFGLWSGESKKT